MKSPLMLLAAALLVASPCLAAPAFSIDDIVVSESAGTAVFTVSLSEPSPDVVWVNWNTQNGSATEPSDYTPISASFFMAPDQLTGEITVPLVNDSDGELAEDFYINLSSPSPGTSIADGQGRATIAESDITTLTWDPGSAQFGTEVQTGTSVPAGYRYFKIQTQAAAGGWRSALQVTAGQANLYAARNSLPTPGAHEIGSANPGSDGWVFRPDQFSPGETWYFLVETTSTASWRLYSGDIYVQNLGTLQYTDSDFSGTYNIGEPVLPSGSGPVTVAPEGRHFFRSTAPNGTPAWSLWLNGDNRPLAVRQATVPYTDAGRDHLQNGAMLLVPPYLDSSSTYFFSLNGTPGETVNLDSRIQAVSDIAFDSVQSAVTVNNAPFRVYRVQVPIDQIAWDVSTTRLAGNPNVCVRRNNVPSQWFNDAFSEVPGASNDSLTLVPPFLTDDTWFITVYSDGNYQFTLDNGPPEITPMAYVDFKQNDQDERAGWRFYGVTNIPSQTGSLGWQLSLADHVTGTEIALRRNAVPGRWNSRNAFDGAITANSGYVTEASTSGLLQQPGHQADIWYVGIYQPAAPLGDFKLTAAKIQPPALGFNNVSTSQSGQIRNSARWFQVEVPPGVLGWDLRLRDITSGNPKLVVARDLLPPAATTQVVPGSYWQPSWNTSWPSGGTWAQAYDWTLRALDADEGDRSLRRFVAGTGHPLEPGTYYVGVFNDSGDQGAYVLESRGIGSGQFYPVTALAFNGGTAPISALAPREPRYFKVSVPADQRSWEITLDATVGELMMTVRRGAIPDPEPTYLPFTQDSPSTEARMQKTGDERYVILPPDGTDYLIDGDYYIAVIGEGQSPVDGNHTGTATSSGTLTSHGPLLLTSLGTASLAGSSQAVTVDAGQRSGYSFTVAPGTLLIELRLENRTGNPQFSMVPGLRLPGGNGIGYPPYGGEGGQSSGGAIAHPELITLANPPPGDYRVLVSGVDTDVSTADLTLRAVIPPALAYSGGSAVVSDQQENSWKYYRVEVPAGVAGWDLRLRYVTGGAPLMVVGRDVLPAYLGTSFWFPSTYTSWPSGYFWSQATDWTARYLDASGENRGNRRFVAAMGHPLEAGTYYVGVLNSDTNNPTSYVLESRGIGSGQYYPITNLAFTAGSSAAISALDPREPRYFKVSIPEGTRNWQMDLDLTEGEMMFMIRRGAIPDSQPQGNNTQAGAALESRVQRVGSEHYLILPPDESDFLVAGDYYIAVVAEGQSPPPTNQTGFGTSSGTLTSRGSLADIDLGSATEAGIGGPVSIQESHLKSYRFSVPPGTATLEMRLNNRTGNPMMSVVSGARIARSVVFGPAYGSEGGQATSTPPNLYDGELITIPNPPVGEYHLTLTADWDFNLGGWADASADLLIQAVPPTNLTFDGGEQAVSDQQAESWKYFRVVVPSGPLGWDLKLQNVIGGAPQIVVARDSLPPMVSTTYPWFPPSQTQWPTGYLWTQQFDWTGRGYQADFSNANYQHFSAAMGRPLEPGTYYVGVFNSSNSSSSSYTLASRGIGSSQSIAVSNLGFAGGSSVAVNALAPREARYFKVTVPPSTPGWELTLDPSVGEMMFSIRRGYLPDPEAAVYYPTQNEGAMEFKVQKDGPERYVILPPDGGDYLVAGDYYIAVAGEGENPFNSNYIGTGPSSGILASHGVPASSHLGNATVAGIHLALTLEPGKAEFYRFTVVPGTSTLELRLNNRTGNPQFGLVSGSRRPPGGGYFNPTYGSEGGQTTGTLSFRTDDDLITILSPAAGEYSLVVCGIYDGNAGAWAPASADLLIRQKPPEPLNFAASQNGGGGSHTDTRQMTNGERTTYAVNIPVQLGGNPVLGWKVHVSTAQGTARLRIYRNAGDTSPYSMIEVNERTAIIVPPWLTPGNTWYAEVEAQGFTEYTITSSPVELNRNPWTMPTGFNSAVGDSGVENNGTPLPGDQGVDLAQDDWHFYAIDVPSNNGGLLRTELQAISGNPDLYIREDGVPTVHHWSLGSYGLGLPLLDRSLTGGTSEYGNWVPLNGRTELHLKPGRWYLGVKAAGNSNVRYRLKADTGSVTNMALNNAPLPGQTMAGGDWRYYRFTVPLDAPSPWQLTFSQQLGDVVMWIRDTVPPGNMESPAYIAAWDRDNKNQTPYPSFDPAGTHSLAPPQLRPGHTYFAGFRAIGDATFTVSSAYSGTTGIFPSIAFAGGTYSGNIPAGGSTMITVSAPADAFRWKHTSVHSSGIQIRIEQGSLAQASGDVHYSSGSGTDTSLNVQLNSWPWVPNQIYWVHFVNTTGGPLPVSFTMNGTTATTDDDDGDGVPDAWEVAMFGSAGLYNAGSDPDFDSLPNLLEYAFNLPPLTAGVPVVTPGSGLSGLPSVTVVEVSGQKRIRIEYLRIKASPVTYAPQVSRTLLDSGPGGWLPPAGTPVVTSIDATWERVVVDDTAGIGQPERFGRVKVTSP